MSPSLSPTSDKTEAVMKINERPPVTLNPKFRLPSLRTGKSVGIPKLLIESVQAEKFDKIKLITKKIDMTKEFQLPSKSTMDGH